MLSEAAKAIIQHCYRDGNPISIRPIINEKYELNGISFKFTEQLFAELAASGKVKIGNRFKDAVNISGI